MCESEAGGRGGGECRGHRPVYPSMFPYAPSTVSNRTDCSIVCLTSPFAVGTPFTALHIAQDNTNGENRHTETRHLHPKL